MWTTENRARYDRRRLRYPSDLTDAEWALIAPLIPPAKRGGNKRTVAERDVVSRETRSKNCPATQRSTQPHTPVGSLLPHPTPLGTYQRAVERTAN